MKSRPAYPWIRLIALSLWLAMPALAIGQDDAVDFSRDILPLLSNRCFKCHGPDDAAREAELELNTFAGATADLGGYQAIVPHRAEQSVLFERVTSTDDGERMPPPDQGPPLTESEIARIRTWINAGASYDMHWSLRPILRPPIPTVRDSQWPRHAIDHFVLSRMESRDISPSIAADRHTLVRRVYLDLVGLPPSPEESARFVNDPAADAYEQMVDRVLASPHYGERSARHWLDQARYADTNGYTVDGVRSMWPYRDWVIAALNQDMPFDQFTVEQLAGDLLPTASDQQIIATGFHRNTLVNEEGGVDREQFRNEAVVDRVNTTGAVWLGLTVGCAQCHHHKYDPLSQREYYQLFAFFNNTQDANSTTPSIQVASGKTRLRLTVLDAQVAAAAAELADYDRLKNDSLPKAERDDGVPVEWLVAETAAAETESGTTLELLGDGSLLASGPNADVDEYHVKIDVSLPRITAVRLEALTHPSLPKGGPGRAGNGNLVLAEIELTTASGITKFQHATADHSQKNYPIAHAVDGKLETGWAINVEKGRANVNRTAEFVLSEAVTTPSAGTVDVRLRFSGTPAGYNLGRFRLSLTDAPLNKFKLPDRAREELAKKKADAEAERKKFATRIPTTMIMRERDATRETHIHIRGDFLRQGDLVKPDSPAVLPPLGAATESPTRWDLARWLVREDHPLTPRVTVNRLWMRLFGRGLVETENDFGVQGSLPTHPELLDWLSREFVDQGWSLKTMHRLIVTSATYRQSSVLRPELQVADPQNKLLARQARLRVDAETIRDLALAASGRLTQRIGGPSVYPPQPAGVYAFTQRNAGWPTSKGESRYRRGLYTFFMRSAPYPFLTTFDTPRFNVTCTRRIRSNTPLQSLTLANDESLVELIRALASRLEQQTGTDLRQRIKRGFQLCLGRPPSTAELDRLTNYWHQIRDDFSTQPEATKQLTGASRPEDAAWFLVARVLVNLDEFIVRE